MQFRTCATIDKGAPLTFKIPLEAFRKEFFNLLYY